MQREDVDGLEAKRRALEHRLKQVAANREAAKTLLTDAQKKFTLIAWRQWALKTHHAREAETVGKLQALDIQRKAALNAIHQHRLAITKCDLLRHELTLDLREINEDKATLIAENARFARLTQELEAREHQATQELAAYKEANPHLAQELDKALVNQSKYMAAMQEMQSQFTATRHTAEEIHLELGHASAKLAEIDRLLGATDDSAITRITVLQKHKEQLITQCAGLALRVEEQSVTIEGIKAVNGTLMASYEKLLAETGGSAGLLGSAVTAVTSWIVADGTEHMRAERNAEATKMNFLVQLGVLEVQNNTLRDKLLQQQHRLDEKNVEIDRLTAGFDNYHARFDTLSDEFTAYRESMTQQRTEHEALILKLKVGEVAKDAAFAAQKQAINRRIEAQATAIRERDAQVATQLAEIQHLSQQLERNRSDTELANAILVRNSALVQEMELLQAAHVKLQKEIVDLRAGGVADGSIIREEKVSSVAAMPERPSAQDALRASISSLQEINQSLMDQLTKRTRKITELEAEREGYGAENQAFKARNKELAGKLDVIEAEKNDLALRNAALTAEMENIKATYARKHKRLAGIEADINEILGWLAVSPDKNPLTKIVTAKLAREKMRTLIKERESYRLDNITLRNEVAALGEERNALQERNRRLSEEIAALRKQSEADKAALAAALAETATLREQNVLLQRRQEEFEVMQQRLAAVSAVIAKFRDESDEAAIAAESAPLVAVHGTAPESMPSAESLALERRIELSVKERAEIAMLRSENERLSALALAVTDRSHDAAQLSMELERITADFASVQEQQRVQAAQFTQALADAARVNADLHRDFEAFKARHTGATLGMQERLDAMHEDLAEVLRRLIDEGMIDAEVVSQVQAVMAEQKKSLETNQQLVLDASALSALVVQIEQLAQANRSLRDDYFVITMRENQTREKLRAAEANIAAATAKVVPHAQGEAETLLANDLQKKQQEINALKRGLSIIVARRTEIVREKAAVEQRNTELLAENSRLTDRIAQLERSVAVPVANDARLTATNGDLRAALEKLRSDVRGLEERNQQARGTEIAALMVRNEAVLAAQKAEAADEQSQAIARLNAEHAQAIARLQAENAALVSNNARQRAAALEAAARDKQTFDAYAASAHAENIELRRRIQLQREAIELMEAKNADAARDAVLAQEDGDRSIVLDQDDPIVLDQDNSSIEGAVGAIPRRGKQSSQHDSKRGVPPVSTPPTKGARAADAAAPSSLPRRGEQSLQHDSKRGVPPVSTPPTKGTRAAAGAVAPSSSLPTPGTAFRTPPRAAVRSRVELDENAWGAIVAQIAQTVGAMQFYNTRHVRNDSGIDQPLTGKIDVHNGALSFYVLEQPVAIPEVCFEPLSDGNGTNIRLSRELPQNIRDTSERSAMIAVLVAAIIAVVNEYKYADPDNIPQVTISAGADAELAKCVIAALKAEGITQEQLVLSNTEFNDANIRQSILDSPAKALLTDAPTVAAMPAIPDAADATAPGSRRPRLQR